VSVLHSDDSSCFGVVDKWSGFGDRTQSENRQNITMPNTMLVLSLFVSAISSFFIKKTDEFKERGGKVRKKGQSQRNKSKKKEDERKKQNNFFLVDPFF
jgi:hypothetical protein